MPTKKKKQTAKQRIAALQAELEEQALQKIASLASQQAPVLPPPPTTDQPPTRPPGILCNPPLQPSTGFT